jgi:Ca-activated chloride channel family protein
VLAVFKTEADRLLLPKSLRFEELVDLVRSGQLEFGHTDPRSSTSGLYAVLSEFSFFSGKKPGDLTLDDISNFDTRRKVRAFEWKTVHYVDIANVFAAEWCRYGVGFASAAYMQETTLNGFNARCRTQLRAVPIADSPFVADYPFIVLRAPWVSKEEQDAAEVFGGWLEARLAAHPNLAASGFRRAKKADATSRRLANAEALKAMQEAWSEVRRPANVLLLVDESQRMALQGKEELVREALLQFFTCPGNGSEADDRVGMITFGGPGPLLVCPRVPIADFDRTGSRLEKTTRSLAAQGASALYDALARALASPDLRDPTRTETVIVFTDGEDDSSSTRLRAIETKLLGLPIQVLVVPYGTNAAALDLLEEHVVRPALGRFFRGDVSDSEAVKNFVCAYQ